MGRREKKTGKGRLDKYYKLAKEQGYRARSAFKLIQLDKKFQFLQSARCLIDLCAAPGGWLQVASKYMPPNSLLVGVDLVPIKAIPRCVTIADDITTDSCRKAIRSEIKDWKADVVLHDGAPNVGTAWAQDAFTQAELVLASLRLAVDFLAPGGALNLFHSENNELQRGQGTFVTKIFRSKDYNSLLWVFNQLFKKVEATKPPSSRNVSAEIFVVCSGYLAPKKIDPKFLSDKHVFKDLDLIETPAAGTSALDKLAPIPQNIFHPEKKRRKREGYGEGDYTLFHALPAADYIRSHDPIDILGRASKLEFATDDDRELLANPLTSSEVRMLCQDLKVLGKKDFKTLLKWRSSIRESQGMDAKVIPEEDFTDKVEVESMDEDAQLEAELAKAQESDAARQKREKRKVNERRARETLKLQLSMGTPMELGMERTDDGIFHGDLFDLEEVDGQRRSSRLADASDAEGEEEGPRIIPKRAESEPDSDEDDDDRRLRDLEGNLDQLYDDYQNRRLERDAKAKVKEDKRKKANAEGEWQGIDDDKGSHADDDEDDSEVDLPMRSAETFDSDESSSIGSPEAEVAPSRGGKKRARYGRLLTTLEEPKADSISSQSAATALWFDQAVFKGIDNLEELLAPVAREDDTQRHAETSISKVDGPSDEGSIAEFSEDDAESVSEAHVDAEGKVRPVREDLRLVTAEALTLASQLVNREKTKSELIDDGFHRYAFQDKDNVPAWFVDDEMKHFRSNVPVTKDAVEALRAKMRALNARPIKKIAEAKARKKMRATRRLARMQKKADVVNESADLTEREKADQINKLIKKASKEPKTKKSEVKLVVAKGANRGIKGRPGGVKGRYKIVDSRMKKEVRALDRVRRKGASKKHNRRHK